MDNYLSFLAIIQNQKIIIKNATNRNKQCRRNGDNNYNAASTVSQSLEVQISTLQNQSISFATLSSKTYGDADFAPGGTASSGLNLLGTSFVV
mgnify:CR=1 FL=1